MIKNADSKLSPTIFDRADQMGNNPEHYASMEGNVQCLRFLIKKGGNIDYVPIFIFFYHKVNNEGFKPKELL